MLRGSLFLSPQGTAFIELTFLFLLGLACCRETTGEASDEATAAFMSAKGRRKKGARSKRRAAQAEKGLREVEEGSQQPPSAKPTAETYVPMLESEVLNAKISSTCFRQRLHLTLSLIIKHQNCLSREHCTNPQTCQGMHYIDIVFH